jgi:hypothetical protein
MKISSIQDKLHPLYNGASLASRELRRTKGNRNLQLQQPFCSIYCDNPDSKLNVSNAHHPKHDIDIDLAPDLELIDGLHHAETFHHHHHHPNLHEENDTTTKEKVSPWIYPKFHQEITGRPEAYLGGCDIRVQDRTRCRPKKLDTSWLIHKEGETTYETNDPWHPKEWLVAGKLSPRPPKICHVGCIRCEETEKQPIPPDHIQSRRHPSPIPIRGHPVKDSPFIRQERTSE